MRLLHQFLFIFGTSTISSIILGVFINGTVVNSLATTSTTVVVASRRRILSNVGSVIFGVVVISTNQPQQSIAVTDKNDVLCQTGFFTNIMQYRCTEIGDISDEGLAQELSSNQVSATDALLSKLNMNSNNSTTTSSSSSSSTTGTNY